MSFFDNTRDNIKVQQLTDEDRKQMFNKFRDAGGEVIKEKKKRPIIINREKQRELVEKMDSHYQQSRSVSGSSRRKSTFAVPESIVSEKKENIFIRMFDSFKTRFVLSFSGVTDFSGSVFKQKFFERYKSDYQTALAEMQLLYMDLFKQNIVLANRIIDQLDRQKPLYFELIEMMADVFDRTINGQIIDSFIAFPDEEQLVREYRNPILAFFKKLYPLYLYQDHIYIAYEKAILLQAKLDKNGTIDAGAKKKKLRNNLYTIFNKLFPKLYWLFCKYHGAIIALHHQSRIEEILLIGPDMKPGNRVAATPSSIDPENISRTIDQKNQIDREESENAKQILKKNTVETIPPHILKGLTEMKKMHPPALYRKYAEKDDILKTIGLSDKVMLTYLYFSEFDHELSFLLTTNKIKYQPTFDKNQKKIIYKAIFENFFNKINPVYDAFKQYFSAVEANNFAISDKPVSNEQYMKYSKRITETEKERKLRGLNARSLVANYMQKLSEHLGFVLKDINGLNKIVENSRSPLIFEKGVEENKIIRGMTIAQAFEYLYNFTSAFRYKLSPAGNLSGEIEISDNEPVDELDDSSRITLTESIPEDQLIDEDIKVVTGNEPSFKSSDKKELEGSVMSELDDLI
ncbi:MAG: hypothetical protein JW982_04005 [Spirochaetes bacterium]|nr:hypothetical protein [Spirochaetota bacterium]